MTDRPTFAVLRNLAALAGVDSAVLDQPETTRYLQDLAEAFAGLPERTGEPPLVPFDPRWPEEAE